jgi:two-component system sensor histidine kinase AgrC
LHILFTVPSMLYIDGLLLMWIVDYRNIFQKKECIFLSIYLTLALLMSILYPYILDWFFLSFVIIIRSVIIVYRYNNLLIPVVSFLWKFTFLLFIWLLTYDFPLIFFSFNSLSSLQTIFLLVFAQLLLLVPICFLIRHFIKLFNVVTVLNSVKKKYRLFSILVIAFYTITIVLYLQSLYSNSTSRLLLSFLIVCISGFLFSIIFYFISKDYKQSEEFKIMAHLLSHNTQQYELTSNFIHDYNGILLSLNGYLDSGDLEGAKKYLHSIVDYSADILGSKYYLELTKITVTPVIAVLSTFSEKATNLQIDIALTVTRPLYYVNMDLIDFIRCLNILLNNAFESVQDQPNSFIQVIFENNEKYLSLIIKNPDTSTIPLEKIMKKGFSSKSNHSGKGLHIVSKICNNYNNVHFAIHRINGIFTTTLTIHY